MIVEATHTLRLGDCCDVIAGQSPKGTYYNDKGEGLPFYQGKKEFGDRFIGDPTTWTSFTTKEAEKGDILMSVRAPVGPINFATQKVCIGRGLAAIRASERINRDYLFYQLLSKRDEISGSEGAVFNSINKTQIGNIQLFVPPLPEQERIVAKLDAAFAAIEQAKANVEQNLHNAKELFQSKLNEVFSQRGDGWLEKKLGDVASFRNGLNFTKSSSGQEIKLVGVADFKQNFWVPLEQLTSAVLDSTLNEEDRLKKGDILTVRSNGNQELIGRCMLAPNVAEPTSHSGFTIRIRLTVDDIHPPYLNHFLKSDKARRELIDGGTGVNIKSLSQGILKKLPIGYPDLEKQKRIVHEIELLLDKTNQLQTHYTQKLIELEELKKSLLERAFKGEI